MADINLPVTAIPGDGEQFNVHCPYPECGFESHSQSDTGSYTCINPFLPTHVFTMARSGDLIIVGIE